MMFKPNDNNMMNNDVVINKVLFVLRLAIDKDTVEMSIYCL